MSQIEKGVIYYKRPADYEGDFTKGCGLAGDEIDSNIHFLRGNDIESIVWDKDTEILTFNYVNGSSIDIDGINDIKPDALTTNEILNNLDNLFKIIGGGYTSDIGKNENGVFEIDDENTLIYRINKQREDFEEHLINYSEKVNELDNKDNELVEKDNSLEEMINNEISDREELGRVVNNEINERITESTQIKKDVTQNKVTSFSNNDGTLNTKVLSDSYGTYLMVDLILSKYCDFLKIDRVNGGLTDSGLKSHIDTEINRINTSLTEKINSNNEKISALNRAIDAINTNGENLQTQITDNDNEVKSLIAKEEKERKDDDVKINNIINTISTDISSLTNSFTSFKETQEKTNSSLSKKDEELTTTLTTLDTKVNDNLGTVINEIGIETARAKKTEQEIKDLIGLGFINDTITNKINTEILTTNNKFKNINELIETNTGNISKVEKKLDDFLYGSSKDDVINTLIEIQNYIDTHGDAAAVALLKIEKAQETADEAKSKAEKSQGEVDALETLVEQNKTDVNQLISDKVTDLTDEINTLGTTLDGRLDNIEKDYLKSIDKTELTTKINNEVNLLETSISNNRKDVVNYIDNEVLKVSNRLSNTEEDFDSRLDTIEKDYLKNEDKTNLVDRITKVVTDLTTEISERKSGDETLELKYKADDELIKNDLTTLTSDYTSNKEKIDGEIDDITISIVNLINKDNLLDGRLSELESIYHDAYKDADAVLREELLNSDVQLREELSTMLNEESVKLTDYITDVKKISEDNRDRITSNTLTISEYIKTVNEAFKNTNDEINRLKERVTLLENFITRVITMDNIIEYAVTTINSVDNDIILDKNIGNVNMELNHITNTTF